MKFAFFDTHAFERNYFLTEGQKRGQEPVFFEARLKHSTAGLAKGYRTVCAFVNDVLDRETLTTLRTGGTECVALRSAGFNHIDLAAAQELGLRVVRVPEYSPYAVAEHAVALILSLNRKTHRSHARVREGNFSLDGLVGFDLHGKTVGVIGTGKIGAVFCRIMSGFGCQVLAYDLSPDSELSALGARYVPLSEIWERSDIVSFHVPLSSKTRHLVDEGVVAKLKPGVMVINTGRGALIDTHALIQGLKSGQIGSAGLDVYEEEEGIFFNDLSSAVLQDDLLARLLTFPNVLVTSHQGFLTHEALTHIAETTVQSIAAFERGEPLAHEVRAP